MQMIHVGVAVDEVLALFSGACGWQGVLSCAMLLGLCVNTSLAGDDGKPGIVANARRVLFFGNSITQHGPAAGIGWTNNWGMAASALDKDYVHIVTSGLAKMAGKNPEVSILNIADFERLQSGAYEPTPKLQSGIDFKADLVIIAIGENVPALTNDEIKKSFKARLVGLLQALKKSSNPTFVVRSCFWANEAKDKVLKEACQEVGGIFVDISALAGDQSNYARSERDYQDGGVANHPGDKGMAAIAKAILDAVSKAPQSVPSLSAGTDQRERTAPKKVDR